MRPYSLDFRERIVVAVDHQEALLRWIARVFGVSTSFIVRLLQRRRATSTLAPKPHAGGPVPTLNPDDHQRLADLIRDQPDAFWTNRSRRAALPTVRRPCGWACAA